jgi:hypothetical protein
VSFAGEGRTVHGSLLLPPGDGPHRALALFHPTSTPRRDDLRFLADLAAHAGLAALIYDRREVPADVAQLTRADFLAVIADAEAAVRFLRSRDDIDGARVGVGGLSQGAWIAAIVATRVPEVGFVVALSAPGVPLHEIDLYQSTRRLQAAGVQGPELDEARALLTDLFAASRGEGGEDGDRDALARRLEQARSAPWAATLALPDEVPPGGRVGDAPALVGPGPRPAALLRAPARARLPRLRRARRALAGRSLCHAHRREPGASRQRRRHAAPLPPAPTTRCCPRRSSSRTSRAGCASAREGSCP